MAEEAAWLSGYHAVYAEGGDPERREAAGRGEAAVDVVVVVAHKSERERTRTGRCDGAHPYLSALPAAVQLHFHPQKWLRDRWEEREPSAAAREKEDVGVRANAAAYAATAAFEHELAGTVEAVARTVAARHGAAYVVPYVAAAQHGRSGYEGLHFLGKRLYTSLAKFLLELLERCGRRRFRLSFIGIGAGGVVVRAAAPLFRSDRSMLALSGAEVALGSYVSVATPHLGLRRGPALGNAWKYVRQWWFVASQGLVGKELLLEDCEFEMMTLWLHDGEAVAAWESFERKTLLALRYDRHCSMASALSLADFTLTPLGKYVHYCNRRGETLPDEAAPPPEPAVQHVDVPSVGTPTAYAAAMASAGALHAQHYALETLFGLPAVCMAMYVCLAYYRRNHLPDLWWGWFNWLVVAEFLMATAGFALFVSSGYIYHSSHGGDVDLAQQYAHLGHPLSRETFYKTTRRVFKTSTADPHAEVCVNVVKEVLNVSEPVGHVARAVLPAPPTWRLWRDPHSAAAAPDVVGRAATYICVGAS